MNLFIDRNGAPTRMGDRVSTKRGEYGVVDSISLIDVRVLLDNDEHPECFLHDEVHKVLQKEDGLGIATQMVRELVELLEAAVDDEEAALDAERAKEDDRSILYTRGKRWAFLWARSHVRNVLRNLERLEMAQDF